MGARWVAFTLALVGAFIRTARDPLGLRRPSGLYLTGVFTLNEGQEVIPASWSIATYPRLSGPGSFPELHV